jgi:hypothetical protein
MILTLETIPLKLAAVGVLEAMPPSATISWELAKRIATAAVGEYLSAATVVSARDQKLKLDRAAISHALGRSVEFAEEGKKRIAELEQQVAGLSEQASAARITELLEDIERMHGVIGKLRDELAQRPSAPADTEDGELMVLDKATAYAAQDARFGQGEVDHLKRLLQRLATSQRATEAVPAPVPFKLTNSEEIALDVCRACLEAGDNAPNGDARFLLAALDRALASAPAPEQPAAPQGWSETDRAAAMNAFHLDLRSIDAAVVKRLDRALDAVAYRLQPEQLTELRAALSQMGDAAMSLWGVVANVSGGNWNQQSLEWQEAAKRSRDEWHRALDVCTKLLAPEQHADQRIALAAAELSEDERRIAASIVSLANTAERTLLLNADVALLQSALRKLLGAVP